MVFFVHLRVHQRAPPQWDIMSKLMKLVQCSQHNNGDVHGQPAMHT